MPDQINVIPPDVATDATLRQVVMALQQVLVELSGAQEVNGRVEVTNPVALDQETIEALRTVGDLVATLDGNPKATIDPASIEELKKALKPVTAHGGSQIREVRVQNANHQAVNPATEDTLNRLVQGKPGSVEKRLDYDNDGNLIYSGAADQGTATSSTEWIIQKLDYDVDGNLVHVQTLSGAWDNRTSLGWS